MVIVLEECTTEEQHSVVHFLWGKEPMQRIFIKKIFPFMVMSHRLVQNWVSKIYCGGIHFTNDEVVETEV
jgi:hypothetical protein